MRFTPVLMTLLCLGPAALFAQDRPNVFADPQNLEVLPADISSAELSNTMRGFAMGLGVRCNDCHVGEPNAPLHTYDFASDEKPLKQKARLMLEMVQDINLRHVPKLDGVETTQRVAVRCVTCHRGQAQPKLIEDVLDEQLAEHGKPRQGRASCRSCRICRTQHRVFPGVLLFVYGASRKSGRKRRH
jgi:hypothetical protein